MIYACAGANNTAEIDLRDVGTLYLIPLAIVQVANQTLAGFTEPVSLERRYPVPEARYLYTESWN